MLSNVTEGKEKQFTTKTDCEENQFKTAAEIKTEAREEYGMKYLVIPSRGG